MKKIIRNKKEDLINRFKNSKYKIVVSFFKDYIKGVKLPFMLLITTTVITAFILILNPMFSRIFANRLLTHINPQWVAPFILILLIITFIQIIVSWIKHITMNKIQGKITLNLLSTYIWKLISLPSRYFTNKSISDLTDNNRVLENICSILSDTVAPLILDMAMLVLYIIVMLNYSVPLTIIASSSIVLNIITSNIITIKKSTIHKNYIENYKKLSDFTISSIERIETIKVCGGEDNFLRKLTGLQANINQESNKAFKIDVYLGIIPSIIQDISNVFIIGIGIYLTVKGNFSLGTILAFQGFLSSLNTPSLNFIEAGNFTEEIHHNISDINEVMSSSLEISSQQDNDVKNNTSFDKLSGNISVKKLSFSYGDNSKLLFENLSFEINNGESVAIVGRTGAGKSTLCKLLSGLYTPYCGEILYDDKKIVDINKSIFSGSVAVVNQDIVLFEDTIANNIKMYDKTIEDFEMILAARDALIHDEVIERENGYKYVMSEGGKDFSSGQRQRFEIARVLSQDPTILILDEATSNLDNITENKIITSILNRGVTTIIVSQKISTVSTCDKILVLDNGKIIKIGKHKDLINSCELYKNLVYEY